ncbi:PspC domain-containing protein [Demequina pelophila]|uniref:PspC domain-containing protein n=1 Tax=Demequina pelophila TaxID=1638984 RepID=UPI0007812491|nr:PspC domain-containing protein [Demequina pelophila]
MTDQAPPPTEAGFFTTIRGWGFTRGDRGVAGGVAAGVADRLGWPLGWTRVAFVAAGAMLTGMALLAYAAAWALLPDRRGRIVAQDLGRGEPNVGAIIVIAIVAVLGLANLNQAPWMFGAWGWGDAWPWDQGPFTSSLSALGTVLGVLFSLAVLAGVAVLVVLLVRQGRDRSGGTPGAPGAPRPDPGPVPGTAPGSPSTPDGGSAAPGDPGTEPGPTPIYAVPPAWAADRARQRADNVAAAHRAADDAVVAGQAAADAATEAAHRAASDADLAASATTAATAGAWAPEQARAYGASPAAPGAGQPPYGGASYPAAPYAGAPYPAGTHPAAPSTPPRPPRVPGPGAAFYLLTLAWFVLSIVGVALAAWQDRLAVPAVPAWIAVFVTGLGVLLAIVALVGRKLGFLGFLGGLLLLPLGAVIVQADEIRDGSFGREWIPEINFVRDGDDVVHVRIGDLDIYRSDPESTAGADPLAVFEDEFSVLIFPGSCEEIGSHSVTGNTIVAQDLTGERRLSIEDAETVVRIDAGAGVAVDAPGGATVVWPGRGLSCEVPAGDALAAMTPTQPFVTLDVAAEGAVVTIEEVSR